MGAAYKVTAPAVVIRNTDKGERYLYAGAVFTDESVRDGEVARMLDLGFIAALATDAPDVVVEPAQGGTGTEPDAPGTEPDAPAPRKGRTPPRGKAGAPADGGKELADLTVDQLRAEAAARGIEVPEGVTDPADLVAILEQ